MDLSFVQTGILLGLLGLAVPLIVHFTFRSRPRTLEFGSVRFLREILERSHRRKRIMRWFLLSLRMLCIGLLVAAFARPFLTERASGGVDRIVAVLIDDSASMWLERDGHMLVDVALAETEKLLANVDSNSQIEVAFFNQTVRPARDGDASGARQGKNIGQPQSHFATTDYATALHWAADVCAKSGAAHKEAHLFTDLQRSGLAWSEAPVVPEDVVFHVHDLGRDLVNNVAVTSAAASQLVVRPGEPSVLTVDVHNAGPFTMDELPLVLHLQRGNQPILMRRQVNLASGAAGQVRFELPALAQGFWKGTVGLETADDLAFDNVRHVAIMAAAAWRVLLVDGNPAGETSPRSTHFLDLAIRLAPPAERLAISPYSAETLSAAEAPLPDLAERAVVVLSDVADLAAGDVGGLADFVSAGGAMIVFSGPRMTSDGCRTLSEAGLLPGEVKHHRLVSDLPFRLGDWDRGHSIFRPFDDPQHGDLRGLTFRGCTVLEPSATAQVLARFFDGTPALVEHTVGRGRVLWFASTCDLQWGDWPRSPLYVPIVHQLLGYLTGLNEGGPVRTMLTSEAAETQTPGVHDRGDHWQIVNVDTRESETERCTVADLVNRFNLNVQTGTDEQVLASSSAGPSRIEFRKTEFWHWVIVVLIGAAMLEYFLANRTTA